MSRRIALLIPGLLALTAPRPAAALEASNLQLVTQTARQAVEEALAGFASGDVVEGPTRITVDAADNHGANWLVEHLLVDALLTRGLTVATDAGDQPADTRLVYRVVDVSVTGRSSLLGGSVERRCRVVLRLDLERQGEQLVSGDGHAELHDRIPKNQLDALQHSRYRFAETEIEERSWGRYVEPVIITSVLGSLVYLFFSNR